MASTMHIAIDKHYCGSFLVDVSIFSEAEKCGMEMNMAGNDIEKPSCCKDVLEIIEGQDELNLTKIQDIEFSDNYDLTLILISDLLLFAENNFETQLDIADEGPPLPEPDLNILHQVFLI